jgi:DNA polymerase-3 subunit beta
MQTIVDKKTLTAALKSVCRVAPKRFYAEILLGVRIDAAPGGITFTTTDLDLTETYVCPADVDAGGTAIVPAHAFAKFAAGLADGPVLMETVQRETGEFLTVSAGASEFELSCKPAADWPQEQLREQGAFTMPAETVRHILAKTRHAISTEETRFYLNGLCLDVVGRPDVLAAVTTDGHRLALVEIAKPEGADVLKMLDSNAIVIPRATCHEIAKAFAKETGPISISAMRTDTNDVRIGFAAGPVKIVSKLIAGTFPDYRRVIPTEDRDVMTVQCDALAAGLDRVSSVAADKARAVKFTVNGKLVLSVVNPDAGMTREEIRADWTRKDGHEFEIGFNGKYVADILATMDGDRAQFHFDDAGATARIVDSGDASVLHVLMPMRV